MEDPKTHRMIHTRDAGVVSIPRSQEGVPLRDYFRNAELPKDLGRAMVYATPAGPIAADPDPQPWAERHDEKAKEYAGRVKDLIEQGRRYAPSMEHFAGRLARETGLPSKETKAVIVAAFAAEYGREPIEHMDAWRRERGLPVTPRGGRDRGQETNPEPER